MNRFAFGAVVFAIKYDVQNDAIAAVGRQWSRVRSSCSVLNGNSAASQHYRRERQQPTEQGRNTIDWRSISQLLSYCGDDRGLEGGAKGRLSSGWLRS